VRGTNSAHFERSGRVPSLADRKRPESHGEFDQEDQNDGEHSKDLECYGHACEDTTFLALWAWLSRINKILREAMERAS
jgi:hypothetical protein